MQKIRSHKWDVGIQVRRINKGRINEGRLCILKFIFNYKYNRTAMGLNRLWQMSLLAIKSDIGLHDQNLIKEIYSTHRRSYDIIMLG